MSVTGRLPPASIALLVVSMSYVSFGRRADRAVEGVPGDRVRRIDGDGVDAARRLTEDEVISAARERDR